MVKIKMTTNAVILNFDGDHGPLCEKGATFEFPFTWEDSTGNLIDLSAYTFKMQVKDSNNQIIVELTDDNGRVFLDSNQTLCTLYISATDTTELKAGKYSYDFFITDTTQTPNKVTKLFKGVFEIEKSITS